MLPSNEILEQLEKDHVPKTLRKKKLRRKKRRKKGKKWKVKKKEDR